MNTTIKNQKVKDYFTVMMPSIVLIILAIIYFIFSYQKPPTTIVIVGTGDTINTGSLVNTDLITTGTIQTGIVELPPIPKIPREYVEYVKEYGKEGVDYIKRIPPTQPIVRYNDKEKNNQDMENYFSKNMLDIVLPQSGGYLFIVTKKEIPENRSLFIGIDGKRMGAVSLTNKYSLDVRNTNEYLYDIEEMPLINIKVPTSLYKYGNPISMNFYVGEKGNGVSEIRVIPR